MHASSRVTGVLPDLVQNVVRDGNDYIWLIPTCWAARQGQWTAVMAAGRCPVRGSPRPYEELPERVQSLLDRRAHAVQGRRAAYRHWHDQRVEQALEQQQWIDQHLSRDRGRDQGLLYGLEL